MKSREVGGPSSGRLCLPDTQGPRHLPAVGWAWGSHLLQALFHRHPLQALFLSTHEAVSISQKEGSRSPEGGRNPKSPCRWVVGRIALLGGSSLRGSERRLGCSGSQAH